MQGSTKIPITDLNVYITCKICNGYFVDACTIIECLHTFCRSCIIKYFQNNKYCPVCDVQVHKSKPLLNIRPDKTLQDIVYKLVPRLFQNEMQRRREFYESHPDAKPSSLEQCGEVAYQYLLTPEETICLTLGYHGADNKPRYLRCPAAVTMGHLKKLIRAKYDLSDNHRVDILYNQDCLSSSLTLIDIAYIYLWKRKGPIELTYRIYENTAKKLKLEQPQNTENPETNTINNNNNNINNNNNWKEVQLRISENGEMSITGIQDSLSPSLLEIVDSEPKYKNDIPLSDTNLPGKQILKKELPDLKFIGKANTPCTVAPTTSETLPIENLNNLTVNLGRFVNTSTFAAAMANDNLTVSLSSPSSSCATLSSGSTTTVFSTINTSKCSTKSEETEIKLEKPDQVVTVKVEKPGEVATREKEGLKRKLEPNCEAEPPAKQPKPIILNHNIGLLNLSNNHPLKKHSKFNRNGENVKDLPNQNKSLAIETKPSETIVNSNKPSDLTGPLSNLNKKDEPKTTLNKNFIHSRLGTPKSTSKPLAMRAKTLISETGVKPPCYHQPSSIYSALINVPRPLSTVTSVNLSPKTETRIPPVPTTRSTAVPSQTSQNSTPKPSNIPVSQSNHTVTPLSRPTVSSSNKIPNSSPSQQVQSNASATRVPSTTLSSQGTDNLLQGTTNKLPTTSPNQPPQSAQSTSSKSSTTHGTASPQHQPSQNSVNKMPNSTIKAKPSTPIGYKTLRDPPKSWNSQISKANLTKSSPDPKYPDLKNVRPAKFFKMRNNMPRYLGNPASGVKPMYQVHVSPEKEKATDSTKGEKSEIKKHSIVKIDPKTLKPVSEKAPETTSLSNHSTILHTPVLNPHTLTNQMSQFYPNPNQCLNTAVTTINNVGINIQNDLKINTSSVSITNPLKLQSSSPKERKSPKSPHSPKLKTTSPPTGNKRDNKITRNFTPPNPFVPNIPTKPSLSPNQFIYPPMPPGFPTYDPRVMAAYYNQWYSQRMAFPPTALTGLNIDLNQRKGLEMMSSPGSPKMDALAQTILNHQMPSRPTLPPCTNISPLQRSHNVPPSPTISKPHSESKKPTKEPKNEKSLETVVEKMTQNRNKVNSKPQTESPKKELEANKVELQKIVAPSVLDKGTNNSDTKADQKVTDKISTGTNQLLKIATENNTNKVSDKTEQKKGDESNGLKKETSETPKEPVNIVASSNCNTPKVPEPPEKENSNTQNTVRIEEKVEKKSEKKEVSEEKSQIAEVKEKE